MKLRILRDTVADGSPVFVDDICEVSEKNARTLIALRKAELYVPKTKASKKEAGEADD